MGVITSTGHMLYAFGKVGKQGMVLNSAEGRTTDGNTARLNGKDMFVWLPDKASCCMVLPFVFMLCIHFEKVAVA